MYLPPSFTQRDPARRLGLMRARAFGVLVVSLGGRLEASHVPFLVDAEDGRASALRFHLARPNPAVPRLDGAFEALAIFAGPHAYVSPDWYAGPGQVPTWNYTAVHAWGRPAPIDGAALDRLLDDLAAVNEEGLGKPPWTRDALPPQQYAAMLRGIVGYHMPIARIEAKWKLGQNRSAADRRAAARALGARDGADEIAVAALMQEVDGG